MHDEQEATFERALRRHVPALRDATTIDPSMNLADYGLTSLGVIDLVIELETELDIFIPDERLESAIESVATLREVVESELGLRTL